MNCCHLLLAGFLLAFSVPAIGIDSGDYLIRAHGIIVGTTPVLSYDDEMAYWLTWSGLYRGVWFDVTDFNPTGTGFEADYTEYWFYHHASYPWDTASFYAELWNGTSAGPTALLDQTSVMATHNTAVVCIYSPALSAEGEFWALINTSMSSGGWPSNLCDNGPNFTGQAHSFYSDDFIIWEPWTPASACSFLMTMEPQSWGGIKSLFR